MSFKTYSFTAFIASAFVFAFSALCKNSSKYFNKSLISSTPYSASSSILYFQFSKFFKSRSSSLPKYSSAVSSSIIKVEISSAIHSISSFICSFSKILQIFISFKSKESKYSTISSFSSLSFFKIIFGFVEYPIAILKTEANHFSSSHKISSYFSLLKTQIGQESIHFSDKNAIIFQSARET